MSAKRAVCSFKSEGPEGSEESHSAAGPRSFAALRMTIAALGSDIRGAWDDNALGTLAPVMTAQPLL